MLSISNVKLLIAAIQALTARNNMLANDPPNIIYIMIDALGYGDIGCYGSQSNKTLNIDRLAEQGMRFTGFHSNGPMCTPTRAAFMTGLYKK